MKSLKYFSLIILFLQASNIFAQDVIFMKNGDEIVTKVLNISDSEVSYKKQSNLQGPTYTVNKNLIFMIKYANGEKDVFGNKEENNTIIEEKEQYIKALPDSNNIKLISMMNSLPTNIDKKKNRKSGALVLSAFMGVTDNSVLSSNELEVSFDRSYIDLGAMKGETLYNILLKNKTDNFLYIDKSCCFIIDKDGNACPFYSPNEVSQTKGHNVGVGLSLGTISGLLGIKGILGTVLGGLSFNGGFSNYSTVTKKDQQHLIIPPKGTIYLVKGLRVPLFFCQKNSIRMGECKSFTYSESPMKWSYIITYSKDKNFSNFSSLNIMAYCKYLYGYMGQPIFGGNLVISPMLIYPCQVYTNFNCVNKEATKYNTWKANK